MKRFAQAAVAVLLLGGFSAAHLVQRFAVGFSYDGGLVWDASYVIWDPSDGYFQFDGGNFPAYEPAVLLGPGSVADGPLIVQQLWFDADGGVSCYESPPGTLNCIGSGDGGAVSACNAAGYCVPLVATAFVDAGNVMLGFFDAGSGQVNGIIYARSVDAGPTVVTTLNATTSSTSPLTLGAFAGHAWIDAGAGVVTAILNDTGQVGAPAVDGGFGVFSTLWSALSLGTFGGFASVDAGFGVFSGANIGALTANSITDTGAGNFLGQVGAPAVDGGFGVFSTLWSALSLGTFGGFGSVDAGPTVVTTLNATTSSTSPLTLGAFGGFTGVDAGLNLWTATEYVSTAINAAIFEPYGAANTATSSVFLWGGTSATPSQPAVIIGNGQTGSTAITAGDVVGVFNSNQIANALIATIRPQGTFWSDAGDVDVGSHLQSHHTLPTLTVTSTQGGIIPPDAGANGCTPGSNTVEATCIYGTDTSGIIVINLDGGLTPYVQELVGVIPSMAFPDGGWTVMLTKYRGGSTPLGSIGPSAAIALACDGINFAVDALTGGWGITGEPNSFYPTTGLFNDGGKAACAIGYHVIGWSG